MLTGKLVEKVVPPSIENVFQLLHGNPFLIFHDCPTQSQTKQGRQGSKVGVCVVQCIRICFIV